MATQEELKGEAKEEKKEQGSSLSKEVVDEQLISIIEKIKKEEENKKELDKQSENLAKKLQEEEKVASVKAIKEKVNKSKLKCSICNDQIDILELYTLEGCDDIFHKECIRVFTTDQVR